MLVLRNCRLVSLKPIVHFIDHTQNELDVEGGDDALR